MITLVLFMFSDPSESTVCWQKWIAVIDQSIFAIVSLGVLVITASAWQGGDCTYLTLVNAVGMFCCSKRLARVSLSSLIILFMNFLSVLLEVESP